jgi:hypothetical protein
MFEKVSLRESKTVPGKLQLFRGCIASTTSLRSSVFNLYYSVPIAIQIFHSAPHSTRHPKATRITLKMRFTYLLALLPAVTFVSGQDLVDSLLSEAAALTTASDFQSALAEASSLVESLASNPTLTSAFASLTSEYASEIASFTSENGDDLASFTSVVGSAASDAAASASAASGEDAGDAGSNLAIPAMGVIGAGVLGLAVLL